MLVTTTHVAAEALMSVWFRTTVRDRKILEVSYCSTAVELVAVRTVGTVGSLLYMHNQL